MDSKDVAHVPAPNPAAFWDFKPGVSLLVSPAPTQISLTLKRLGHNRAEFAMDVKGRLLTDWLNMNAPCVAFRNAADEPLLTFTLRKIDHGKAFLQVTAAPSLRMLPRP